MLQLQVTLEMIQGVIWCGWSDLQRQGEAATGRIRCTGRDELTWDLWVEGRQETMARSAEERRRREQRAADERQVAAARRAAELLRSHTRQVKPAA